MKTCEKQNKNDDNKEMERKRNRRNGDKEWMMDEDRRKW